jgi:multicomponent Na+:H+ antiporter subunit C
MALYLIVLLFLLGAWGMIVKKNIIKKVIGLSILNSAVVVLFVYLGSIIGTQAPILVKGVLDPVDPLPQALMLTAIVVGICVMCLSMALVFIIYRHFKTLDIKVIEKHIRDLNE